MDSKTAEEYEENSTVILLTIEDDTVRGQLARLFQMRFSAVYTAKTPVEAEELLETHSITHIICGNELLNNQQLGVKLILQWKERFHSIEKTVLYNQSLPNAKYLPTEIDQVLGESPDLHDLWFAVGLIHYPEGLFFKGSQ